MSVVLDGLLVSGVLFLHVWRRMCLDICKLEKFREGYMLDIFEVLLGSY
jgi:hypothetical protein